MLKSVRWSSFASKDLSNLLDYLEAKWNKKVCLNFIEKLDHSIHQIQINSAQFPYFNASLQIRKCVITKHNSLFYRVTSTRIEILRLYDTRQNPNDFSF